MIRVDKNMIKILESIGLINLSKDSTDTYHTLNTKKIHFNSNQDQYVIKLPTQSLKKTEQSINFFSGNEFWKCLKKTEKNLKLFLFRLN